MTAFSRVAVVQNSIGSVFRLNSAPSGPSGPARFHTASPRRSHCQRPATGNTPTHKASGWIGLLKLPSMRIGRSFISSKTAQGATPEPPAARATALQGYYMPDQEPPWSPFLRYRPRLSTDGPRADALIGSTHQTGPTQCCCAGPTCFVSPLSSPSLPRFLALPRLPSAQGSAVPKLDSPYSIRAPSRSRSNRRIRSPAIPGMVVSARRDSKARDLPGPILHRATD